MYRRKRKKNQNDLSTRKLSFDTPVTPDASLTNDTPLRNKKTSSVSRHHSERKQPRKKSILSQRNNSAANDSAVLDEPSFEIIDLLKTRWRIYMVSPLYNFQESKLKIYGKKLCEELCSISNKFDEETSFSALNSTFSVSQGFNPSVDDSYALEVKLTTNNNKNNYVGYFITWKSKKHDENFTSLPMLLAKGNTQMQNLVHKSICKFFDCDIQPRELSSRLLVIHLAKFLNASKEERDETAIFSLQYHLPGFNQTNSITVTLSVLDMVAVFLTLLNQIEEGRNGELMQMNLERLLYEKLLFHILRVYELNLMHADLYKTVFPGAILTSDGEIKWTTRRMLMLGLPLLQEFIEEFN